MVDTSHRILVRLFFIRSFSLASPSPPALLMVLKKNLHRVSDFDQRARNRTPTGQRTTFTKITTMVLLRGKINEKKNCEPTRVHIQQYAYFRIYYIPYKSFPFTNMKRTFLVSYEYVLPHFRRTAAPTVSLCVKILTPFGGLYPLISYLPCGPIDVSTFVGWYDFFFVDKNEKFHAKECIHQ